MQSSVQFPLSSGFQAGVAAYVEITTLSQGHAQSSSSVHHALPGQTQAHSNTQILHALQQDNSQIYIEGCLIPKLKVENGMSYLHQIIYTFRNQPQVYEEFFDILKELNFKSIDRLKGIQRISNLFRGHPELIEFFSTFLPNGYIIEVQPNERVQVSIPITNLGGGATSAPTSLTIHPGGPPTTTIHSTHSSQSNYSSHSTSPHSSPGNAVNKEIECPIISCPSSPISASSPMEPLSILEPLQPNIDRLKAIQRISNLFRGHPELIEFISTFLPNGYRIEVQPNERVQVSMPITNLGGGATSAPTSLTIHPGRPPIITIHSTHSSQSNYSSHSTSPHSSPGNAVSKMAPPQWAYQVENFVNEPDEEFVCSICRAIFCDPVMCPCCHVFCRACVTKWLQSNINCPICRKLASSASIKQTVPIIRNLIMKLMLNCYNKTLGCKAQFSVENSVSHMKECEYELVQCKNEPCKDQLLRKDLTEHETRVCPHRYIKCKKLDRKQFYQKNMIVSKPYRQGYMKKMN